MPETKDTRWLTCKANELRIEILQMAIRAGGGHIGGAFSIIDVMTALYLRVLNHDPRHPAWPERDRLVFSKGHACLALYVTLAECGYFPKSTLEGFNMNGGTLGGHPEHRSIPGVEATAGSLGHGLSIGIGMAIADQMSCARRRVFVILSDGECNEGSVWEGFMSAAQFNLEQLVVIIDSNKLESLGLVSEILNIEPVGERLRLFGWSVEEIDGHDMNQIVGSLENVPFAKGKPTAIIAHTTKGKGVSFMENVPMWHFRGPNVQEAAAALAELNEVLHK